MVFLNTGKNRDMVLHRFSNSRQTAGTDLGFGGRVGPYQLPLLSSDKAVKKPD